MGLLALLAAGCRLSWLQLALFLALLLAPPGTAGCWLPALLAAAGSSPGCCLLLADPDHEIPDFDQFLLEKLEVFCQSPFEPSTLRGVFEGDINCDCIFTCDLSCP